MNTAERALVVALRAIRLAIVPLLSELPNRRDGSHCFDLEDLPDRVVAGMRSGVPKRLQRVLLRCARRLIEEDRSDEPVEDLRTLMRDLTGTWLGLYFLGTPFPHPWEPVARHAERHGYDRDGGIFKAVADVYRSARRALPSDANRSLAAKPLMFLDLRPLAYLKLVELEQSGGADKATKEKSATNTLTDTVRALGACYEMLQLRLYIEAGGPIKHVILEETLCKLLAKAPNNIQEMVELATRVYGALPPKSGQTITIIKRGHASTSQLAKIPGCVLAPEEGVYRSQLATDGGRNGNRVTDNQLSAYRNALHKAVEPNANAHTVGDADSLKDYLQTLLDTTGSTASPINSSP